MSTDTYFGRTWESEEYDRPWRDVEFLRSVYESEEAPTYEEIAEEFGCSAWTIGQYMPEDAQRGGPGLPYEDVALFSGGYDSLVATYITMEELGGDLVVHIDTGTGIDENTEFIRHVCDLYDWPLRIIEPNKTLTEFAIEYGFPKAAAHSWIYRYLKEHPLASFSTELEPDTPNFYTGVRKQESQRRMENVSADQEMWQGRWRWKAPIAEFSDEDVATYIIKHGLPRSPVAETIGRSGECFCGAFADRFSELLTLQDHYPDHYEWLMEVEAEVQAEIGDDEDHCYWGSSGMSSEDLQELIEAEDSTDLTLCVDCEGSGHRTLGHDQDPVYETVYLAGPLSDGDNPFQWHETVMAYDETVNWINPFVLNDYDSEAEARAHADEVYGRDLDAVRNSDAVFVRRIDGYNLCGASIELAVAVEKYGIPTVVWNDAESEVPLMLEAAATDVFDDGTEAIQATLAYARQEVRRRDEWPLVR